MFGELNRRRKLNPPFGTDFLNYGVGIVLSLVLAVAHFAGSAWLSERLFELSGGIVTVGEWTQFGGIDYAWTNLSWLPGGMLLATRSPLSGFGFLLLFAGSGFAGFSVTVALAGLVTGAQPRFALWAWRLWGPLALWAVWVPIPAAATLTYWYTVAY
jgi:hypothetical protein